MGATPSLPGALTGNDRHYFVTYILLARHRNNGHRCIDVFDFVFMHGRRAQLSRA